MVSALSRIKRLFIGEINHTVAKLENPERVIEQGIVELKSKMEKMVDTLVGIKVQYRQTHERLKTLESETESLKNKVIEFKNSNNLGKATRYLQLLEANKDRIKMLKKDKKQLQKIESKLESKIEEIKTTISNFEFEKDILAARYETAKTLKEFSKDKLNLDVSGTIAHLNEMKKKVMKEEMIAEIYEEFENDNDFASTYTLSKEEIENKLKELS